MADIDHGFILAQLTRISYIRQRGPVDHFSRNDYIRKLLHRLDDLDRVFTLASVFLPVFIREQVTYKGNFAYFAFRIADDPGAVESDPVYKMLRQIPDLHLWDLHDVVRKQTRVCVKSGTVFPVQIFQHTGKNAVGTVRMHVIVIPPDDDAVFIKQLHLFCQNGVFKVLRPAVII